MRRHRSDRRNPGSQCAGKRQHPTREGACAEARKAGATFAQPYRCPHCGHWHIGNPSGSLLKQQFQR